MTSVLGNLFKKKYNRKDDEMVYTKEDFDEMFIIPKKVLSLVSIQMSHELSDRQAKWWHIFFWICMTNILVFLPTEFAGMVVSAKNASDFREGAKMFRMIPCFGTVVLSIFKSMKIKYNRPTFENLHREFREMWVAGKVGEEEHQIINPVAKLLNFIVKAYYWGNNFLLTIFMCPACYFSIRRYLGYEAPMVLPFDYLLPYDAFQPIVYEIMLFLQITGAVFVIWGNIAWDMLFCAFISNIAMQFELLSRRVLRLVYVPVDRQLIASYPLAKITQEKLEEAASSSSSTPEDMDVNQQRELVNIMRTHHRLIRLAGDMEAMFSFALLVNFMNSTMIICFCGFCCVLLEKWNELAYKSFFLIALSQTWLLCWFGQKLIDSSLGISQALYECGWYNSSKIIRSSILIMLVRSQKSVRLTTYGFSTISLASYTTIIKTSWSYFTLLHNFYTR